MTLPRQRLQRRNRQGEGGSVTERLYWLAILAGQVLICLLVTRAL